MLTFAFAQGFLYDGNHVGRIRLAVDQLAPQIAPKGIR